MILWGPIHRRIFCQHFGSTSGAQAGNRQWSCAHLNQNGTQFWSHWRTLHTSDHQGRIHPAFAAAGRWFLRATGTMDGSFSHYGGVCEDCTFIKGPLAATGGHAIQALDQPPPVRLATAAVPQTLP